MSEYINRDNLIERIREKMAEIDTRKINTGVDGDYIARLGCDAMYRAYQTLLDAVLKEKVCTDIVRPEKTPDGEWKLLACAHNRTPTEHVFCCSVCEHRIMTYGQNKPWESFCPVCGADMRENK